MFRAERDFPAILYAITHTSPRGEEQIVDDQVSDLSIDPCGHDVLENIVIVYESYLAFSFLPSFNVLLPLKSCS